MKYALLLCLLTGCATPEVVCNMKDAQDTSVSPLGFRVSTTVNVVSQADLDAICRKPGLLGCNTGAAIFMRERPQFSNVCSLAVLGHEVLHEVAHHDGETQ